MTVAVSDPLDLDALEEVRYLVGKQIHPICASIELIKEAIESCYGQKEDATKKLIATLRESRHPLWKKRKDTICSSRPLILL